MSVASNYQTLQPINGGLGSYVTATLPAVTTTLVDATNALVYTQVLPLGSYSGLLEFVFTGGATTAITRFIVLVLTTDGSIVTRSQVLTAVTLPDATANYISIPINFNVDIPTLTPINFYLFADYSGTAISVPANQGYIRLTKIL